MLETVTSASPKVAQTETDTSATQQIPTPETPAPKRKTLGLRPGPNRMTHEESVASLFAKYDKTMRALAGLPDKQDEAE